MKITGPSTWWGYQYYNIYSVFYTECKVHIHCLAHCSALEAKKLAFLWATCVLVDESPGLFVDRFARLSFR